VRTAASGATCYGAQPGEERAHGDRIGGAGVQVADVGGEEIEKAQLAFSPASAINRGTIAPLGRADGMMIASGATIASD
jgi:hypothetical protein